MAAPYRPGRKKRRTREHVIADLSVNFVERIILRCGFSVERIAHDYGIDLLLFTYTDRGEIENGHVEFQLKATDHPRLLADGRAISFSLASGDVSHWYGEPMPVILVVYDARQERGYWLSTQQDVDEVPGLKEELLEQNTVTVRVPTANRMSMRAIRKFCEFKEECLARLKGGTNP